jgi:hypothetical protein
MNKFLHVEYFSRVAREAASSLKAHSAVWFCGLPFKPLIFERQEGKIMPSIAALRVHFQ